MIWKVHLGEGKPGSVVMSGELRTTASQAAGERRCCSESLGARLNPLPGCSWCLRATICPGCGSLAALRRPWSFPTPCLMAQIARER